MRFLFCALMAASLCPAQIVTGSISGSVADPSGLAIPEASVTLLQPATGFTRKTTTDETGGFIFPGLEAGEYTITATKTGFKTVEQHGVRLSTGERLSVGRLVLEIGAVTETVSVTAQVASVQTQSAERSEVITSRQVEDLLVRGRNVTDLLALVPGVVSLAQPEDLSNASNFYVQGNRRTMNNISIDGVPATDMGNGYQLKLTVSQDAVAEVKILVSNYQAEYGRMSGSNLQIVTKSGTRDFHGLGSYFKRHEQFNANNFFNNRNGIRKPRYRFNTWTYNVSGPVYVPGKFNRDRNKLFFFWQQEFWPTKSASTGRVTTPTLAEREGDFSQSLDLNNRLIVVRDLQANAPFPGNIVPASRINPNGQALLKFLPAPNYFDRSVSGGQYNYVFTSDNETPKKTDTLKLDYNINSNNTVMGSFGAFNEDQTGATGVTTATANWPQMRKTWWSHAKSITTRYTRVFSPTVLNEFSFGWLNQPAENSYDPEELRRNQRDAVGFRVGQFSPKANPLNIVPNATFGGVTNPANINTEGRFPLYNRYHLFNWSDNLTVNRGRHTFKTGLYVERFFRHQKKAVNFTGTFDFGRNVNNPLDTGYAYANAALGVFNTYSEISGEAWMHVRTGGTEAFVQDNWKATPRLTLDYGLRMYWFQPIPERDDWMAGFVLDRYDPSRRVQLIQPGRNAQGRRIGVHPVTGQAYAEAQIGAIAPGVGDPFNGMVVASQVKDYPRAMIRHRGVQWAPRFGFAYDVSGSGRTAIRGGFGLFYNRHFTETFSNTFVGQPPLLQEPVITYGEISTFLSAAGLLYPASVFAADAEGKMPTVMNFSLSVQRNVGWGTVVDVGYAGSLGRHLLWRRDINPVPMGANFDPANADPTQGGRPLPAAFLRPIPGYNNINIIEPASSSNYNSLQVTARRRFASGLQFGLAWTWSKAMDFNDADSDSVSPLVPVRIWNYGLASFDRTHVATINYVWDVPAPGWRNWLVRQAVRGWQMSGIVSFVSGAPLGVGYSTTTSVDITGTPSQGARIVVLSDPVLPKSQRSFSRNFRTEVFRMPAVGTIGNAAKTLIRGPGINNFDFAVFKNFSIAERARLQFRCEFYNAFNHTQFSALDATARFDTRTGEQVNPRFGEFSGARPPRQLQFALRFYF